MKLAMSNIAWDVDDDDTIAVVFRVLGLHGVEIAPTKYWPDLTAIPAGDAARIAGLWKDRSLPITSFQALLYGRPDLKVFDDSHPRTAAFLRDVLELAATLGARRLVFGSPKARQRGELPDDVVQQRALEFFGPLGDRAAELGVMLCLEPNPPAYACDWITTSEQGAAFVAAVDSPGFGLHVDTAGMHLAGEDPAAFAGRPCHVHFSAPQLGRVHRDAPIDYAAVASRLKADGYDGVVSIEMRPAGLEAAIEAAAHIRQVLV